VGKVEIKKKRRKITGGEREEKLMWFRTEDGFYVSEKELLNRANKAGLTGIDAYRYMLKLDLTYLEAVKIDFYGGSGRYYENRPVNYIIGRTEEGTEIYAECLIPEDEDVPEDYGYQRMLRHLLRICNDDRHMMVYLDGIEQYNPESPDTGDQITICIDDGWDAAITEV
jgi:hypothetical protein